MPTCHTFVKYFFDFTEVLPFFSECRGISFNHPFKARFLPRIFHFFSPLKNPIGFYLLF